MTARLTRYRVYFDSNDGQHRWYNLKTCHVGLRWVSGTTVEDTSIRIRRARIISIDKVAQ